jgi:uncharacterized protein (DUF952 family)
MKNELIEQDSGAIVHICSRSDWAAALKKWTYQADSLAAIGFIHCSMPSQVLGTANQYFPGRTDLMLVWVDPHHLEAEVRWEAGDAGIFPHVYGPINLEAVTAVLDFPPDEDGVFHTVPGILAD